MLLTIKALIIFYLFSFLWLLYKINVYSNIINSLNINYTYDYIDLEEINKHTSLILNNYYPELISKQPNISTLPMLMTTSYIFNKSEIIKSENNKLSFISQIMQLKKTSTVIALIVLAIISIEWNNLNVFTSGYQKGFLLTIATSTNSGIILGYDHLSIPFILLIGIIFPIVIVSNWTTIKRDDMKYYLTTILSSHYFLIIVFLVLDILMFYVSFEVILPFFFILLGMFGGVQKFRAMYYLFLYTLWGSLFMLIEFLTKIGEYGTGIIKLLEDFELSNSWSLLGAIAVIIAFSVKTPIVPFHLWLPLAHGDANVSGSIVLASIVLKMALYGFIRILIFILLLSFASTQVNMFCIFIFSLIFASTTTIRQNDLKVLVAYSSVAHMGSTLLGGFSNNHFGIFGSILFSIAHGVVSPALFIFVGAVFYDRIGSRIVNYLKGFTTLLPIAVLLFLPIVFGNMGTPLTANFIAEFLCLLATFTVNAFLASVAAISVVLSAVYSIYMFNRISSGSYSTLLYTVPDVNKREFSILFPLLFIMILLGVYPYLLSGPIDLGLSHFLLGFQSNPIFTIFSISYLFDKIKNKLNTIINNNKNIKIAGSLLSCLKFKSKNQVRLDSDSEHSNDSGSINQRNRLINNSSELSDPSTEQLVAVNKIKNWINSQTQIFANRYGNNGRLSESDVSAIISQGQERAIKIGLKPEWLGFRIQKPITSDSPTSSPEISRDSMNQASSSGNSNIITTKSGNNDIGKKQVSIGKDSQPQKSSSSLNKKGQKETEYESTLNDGRVNPRDIISERDLLGNNGSGVLYSSIDTVNGQLNIQFIENILDSIYYINKFISWTGFSTWWPIILIIYPIYKQKDEILLYLSCIFNKNELISETKLLNKKKIG
jgi:NADH-ubiquinone oxidoreductase chain 4